MPRSTFTSEQAEATAEQVGDAIRGWYGQQPPPPYQILRVWRVGTWDYTGEWWDSAPLYEHEVTWVEIEEDT